MAGICGSHACFIPRDDVAAGSIYILRTRLTGVEITLVLGFPEMWVCLDALAGSGEVGRSLGGGLGFLTTSLLVRCISGLKESSFFYNCCIFISSGFHSTVGYLYR